MHPYGRTSFHMFMCIACICYTHIYMYIHRRGSTERTSTSTSIEGNKKVFIRPRIGLLKPVGRNLQNPTYPGGAWRIHPHVTDRIHLAAYIQAYASGQQASHRWYLHVSDVLPYGRSIPLLALSTLSYVGIPPEPQETYICSGHETSAWLTWFSWFKSIHETDQNRYTIL